MLFPVPVVKVLPGGRIYIMPREWPLNARPIAIDVDDHEIRVQTHLYDDANERHIPSEILIGERVYLNAEGYGDHLSHDGEGHPLALDYFDGKLSAVVRPDINEEDPYIVSLEGAREDRRKTDDKA